jgi:hypothetical protein
MNLKVNLGRNHGEGCKTVDVSPEVGIISTSSLIYMFTLLHLSLFQAALKGLYIVFWFESTWT